MKKHWIINGYVIRLRRWRFEYSYPHWPIYSSVSDFIPCHWPCLINSPNQYHWSTSVQSKIYEAKMITEIHKINGAETMMQKISVSSPKTWKNRGRQVSSLEQYLTENITFIRRLRAYFFKIKVFFFFNFKISLWSEWIQLTCEWSDFIRSPLHHLNGLNFFFGSTQDTLLIDASHIYR